MPKEKLRIPSFDKNGNLPPGIYRVSLNHIRDHFAWNKHRKKLFAGLKEALKNLKIAGVKKVWIDGSFITNKDEPNDIDGCWESNSDIDDDLLDDVFLETNPPREEMKEKYGVDFLISGASLADVQGKTVEEFFQIDRNGNNKGILIITLRR